MLEGDEDHGGVTGDMRRELPRECRLSHTRRPPQEIQAFIQPIEQIVQVGNPRGKPLDGDAGLFPLPASFGSLSEYLGQEVTGPLQPAEGRGAERRLDAQRFFFQQDSQRRGRGRVIIEGLR